MNRGNIKHDASRQGFALIATLSVLILLALIAVALLSLSSVALRSSNSTGAIDEARANARMALILAIADLQKTLGPDRAVSARASMVLTNPSRPNVLGVWESWRWEPELDGAPDYSEKAGTFRQWLTSTRNPSALSDIQLPASDLSGVAGDAWQWLMNPATTGVLNRTPTALYSDPGVKAEIVSVENENSTQTGGLGWAIFDQSMGASLDLNKQVTPPASVGEKIAHRFSPPRVRADLLSADLSGLDNTRSALTFKNAVFLTGAAGDSELAGRVHDLSVSSLGVLCDVTRGGLKVDLSSVFESAQAPDALLSAIEGTSVSDELYLPGNGATRWSFIKDHYQHYTSISNAGSQSPRYTVDATEMSPFTDPTEYEDHADSPSSAKLLPVISKLQIIFSIVSHPVQDPNRVSELDQYGYVTKRVGGVPTESAGPVGAVNYAVPMLAYDPVVTLYNPYDVELELPHLRLRIWDPPVAFNFWADADRETGVERMTCVKCQYGWQNLAQLQHLREQEKNQHLRKFFNLMLVDRQSNGDPGDPIIMQPGEVRVFSPYVEDNWTWGFETETGNLNGKNAKWNGSRSFHDSSPDYPVHEKDMRDENGQGAYGMRCVPGWDTRAGFQTHYNWTYGPSYLNRSDNFKVEAVPYIHQRTDGAADFIVDILAGENVDQVQGDDGHGRNDNLTQSLENNDIIRRYEFNFGDAGSHPSPEIVAAALSTEDQATFDDYIIEHSNSVGSFMQELNDTSNGGKLPFVAFSMTAKTTVDGNPTKPWLYNNPVVAGELQNANVSGKIHHSYDLKVEEVSSFTSFPGVEVDVANNNRGFYGSSMTANDGVSQVPAYRIPTTPTSSMGELIHSNMTTGRALPRVTHAFGNSHSHPLIDTNSVAQTGGQVSFSHHILDHSYLLNDHLWDRYYFSSVVNQDASYAGQTRTRDVVLTDLLNGDRETLNKRLTASPVSKDSTAVTSDVFQSDQSAASKMAGELMVKGQFNVNSDSVDAWRAVIMGLRDEAVLSWQSSEHNTDDHTAFPRMGLSVRTDPNLKAASPSEEVARQDRWAGFRALDDAEIQSLAESIVTEIRVRGAQDGAPYQSMGEFVNRRIGGVVGGIHALGGILQTAIDNSGINQFDATDSKAVDLSAIKSTDQQGLVNAAALEGESGEGSPVDFTQGDLLGPLSSFISVRGDTYQIRAYGDSRDANGNVLASAWCEATLQRLPVYIDSVDLPETLPAALTSVLNQQFGRRFVQTSFRWLSADEI